MESWSPESVVSSLHSCLVRLKYHRWPRELIFYLGIVSPSHKNEHPGKFGLGVTRRIFVFFRPDTVCFVLRNSRLWLYMLGGVYSRGSRTFLFD